MQKYYSAIKDDEGDYVTSNDVRYTVKAIDPASVHIPAGREGDMVLLDTLDEFLASMGLEHVDDHTFAPIPEPEPAPLVAPVSVPAWAAKAILEVNGHHTAVESYINDTLTGVDQIVAKRIYFEGNDFVYASPLTQVIKGVLGLADEQAIQLFVDAKALQP